MRSLYEVFHGDLVEVIMDRTNQGIIWQRISELGL